MKESGRKEARVGREKGPEGEEGGGGGRRSGTSRGDETGWGRSREGVGMSRLQGAEPRRSQQSRKSA